MGSKRKLEPPPDPEPSPQRAASPAIDHLFDGDADPARPLGDGSSDVAVDLTSPADEEDRGDD